MRAQVPAVVRRAYPYVEFRRDNHPVIEQEFHPGKGWVQSSMRKRVSASWARKLQRRGVSFVALRIEGRLSDFRTADLARMS